MIALYESFDAEWPEAKLYRELYLTDSAHSGFFLKNCRPLQSAVTDVDLTMPEETIQLLNTLFRHVGNDKRYARVILFLEDKATSLDSFLKFVKTEFPQLIFERRLFIAKGLKADLPVENVNAIIGSAVGVRPFE